MEQREPSTQEVREMNKKQLRKEFPSGWMELARYETLVLAIDALLESPATRKYTVDALAERSGAHPRSLQNHIDSLVDLDIIKEIRENNEIKYTLNSNSPIVDQLYELNATVQRVQDGYYGSGNPNIVPTDSGNINTEEISGDPGSERLDVGNGNLQNPAPTTGPIGSD
jgi:DNA-binding transcriptional ArsR family regulator